MKKLSINLDEDFYNALKELGHRKKMSMAAFVRYALDKTFEDELDAIAGEQALEEAMRDPSSTMSWEEYVQKRGLALPDRNGKKGRNGNISPAG